MRCVRSPRLESVVHVFVGIKRQGASKVHTSSDYLQGVLVMCKAARPW